jgi:hypothetical protein
MNMYAVPGLEKRSVTVVKIGLTMPKHWSYHPMAVVTSLVKNAILLAKSIGCVSDPLEMYFLLIKSM